MSLSAAVEQAPREGSLSLPDALTMVAATAGERDLAAQAAFPEEAIKWLERAGLLAWGAKPELRRPPASQELDLVRSVARADASVGRIVDGHLNAVERLAVQAPAELARDELALIRIARLRAGVWGADPRPDEGKPATLSRRGAVERLNGVKTFCSGAGGIDRALVLAREPAGGPPVAVWVDVSDETHVQVDRSWYKGSGLRASESHRVVFTDAPVLARFGAPGALTLQPWFGRDALRTAASWAGMADNAAQHALADLAARPTRGPLEELAAGRILTEIATIDAWLGVAAQAMDFGSEGIAAVALHGSDAIAAASRRLLDEASRACGSHQFATGGGLDRSRRDLGLFLLQHRLDGAVAAAGGRALDGSEPLTTVRGVGQE